MIATKVSRSHLSGDQVQQACERSLRRLQIDYVDLYQIHWPSQTAKENRLWGAERIRGEFLKLGIRVSKRTVRKQCAEIQARRGPRS